MKPEVRSRRDPAITGRRAAIQVARRYRASPEHVFHAWLDPEVAGSWLFATASCPMARVDIDARVAGSFRFVERRNGRIVEHCGEYLEIVPHRRIAFTLASADHPHVVSRVRVDITERGKGCAVTLRHENLPSRDANRVRARWTGVLYGLGATLDSRN